METESTTSSKEVVRHHRKRYRKKEELSQSALKDTLQHICNGFRKFRDAAIESDLVCLRQPDQRKLFLEEAKLHDINPQIDNSVIPYKLHRDTKKMHIR